MDAWLAEPAAGVSGDRWAGPPLDFQRLRGVEVGENPGDEWVPPQPPAMPPAPVLPPELVWVGIFRFFLLLVFSVHS